MKRKHKPVSSRHMNPMVEEQLSLRSLFVSPQMCSARWGLFDGDDLVGMITQNTDPNNNRSWDLWTAPQMSPHKGDRECSHFTERFSFHTSFDTFGKAKSFSEKVFSSLYFTKKTEREN